MLKYFISAMALVLGLFTVTVVLAFNMPFEHTTTENEFYFKHNVVDPEENWMDIDSWTDNPAGFNCNSGIHPCKIEVPEEQELGDYLNFLAGLGVEYEDLADRPEIDSRSNP